MVALTTIQLGIKLKNEIKPKKKVEKDNTCL